MSDLRGLSAPLLTAYNRVFERYLATHRVWCRVGVDGSRSSRVSPSVPSVGLSVLVEGLVDGKTVVNTV